MDPTIVVALIGGATTIITSIIAVFARRIYKHTMEVRESTVNSHTTPMRHDLDRLINGMELLLDGQRRHDREIAGLREDIRQERQERMALAERVGA